ncbi:cuticle protein AMP1A-like [Homarus americanus]|uniref:cuticle protein AMP1A-like n=1 Tax=Homarus americanus TaxID=6706 RepID=UPI001C45CAE8|nr:cuticle protein AMP1A-like [Homarus americanus]
MKFMIIAALAAVAFAAPQYSYGPPEGTSEEVAAPRNIPITPIEESSEEVEVVPILRDDRVHEDNGKYSFDVETGNGIVLYQSGSPDGPDGAVVKAGEYSYTAPDGTHVVVKFVADENGYQPQSDLLPVAPAFPHPIPQFVLDQIAFAAEEDAARARAEAVASSEEVSAPAPYYGAPQ